jgi:thiamine biosynthesis lipoprotein
LSSFGSSDANILSDFVFDAIGTQWAITGDSPLTDEVKVAVAVRCDEFDRTYSRFRPDSLVRRLASEAGTVEFPADAGPLFEFYHRLYRVTDGAVNPLVGQAVEHLGYDADYSLQRRPGPATVPVWDDVLEVEGATVTARHPVLIDVGAAGKGYLVDLLDGLLTRAGVADYLIDGGGDLIHRGDQACRVALEDPTDPESAIGVANVRDMALCGSAINRRRWGDGLHHVIDTASGEPTTAITATWATADTAMIADGLATALFFTDPARLARDFNFAYVRLPATGGVEYSSNFDGELFI